MQIDLSTEYVKMADLLSVDPVGLQVKVQVISGTVLVTETMTQPQASSNFGFAFGKTQIFTSTGAGGDLYIRGTTQNSTIEGYKIPRYLNKSIQERNSAPPTVTSTPHNSYLHLERNKKLEEEKRLWWMKEEPILESPRKFKSGISVENSLQKRLYEYHKPKVNYFLFVLYLYL